MKLNKKLFKNFEKRKINLITVDGITCSGKSLFANLLQKNLQKDFKEILILSKDLFLYSRTKRIEISKKIKNTNILNQNYLHYDLVRLKMLLNFLIGKSSKKTLEIKNLYNRKTGKNDLKLNLKFSKIRLVIFEGLYVNQDVQFIKKPILKILLIEKVYESLSRKIQRIRDKKISIQLVVTEFVKIHLQSYKKYLKKNNFDLFFEDLNRKFIGAKNGKNRQLRDISAFLKKHMY
jgi:uridine kinase